MLIRTAVLLSMLCMPLLAYAQTLGGSYTLQDSSGATVTEKSNKGKFTLITFAHSKCDQTCKDALKNFSTAIGMLSADARSKVDALVVSVDPADTPAAMAQFLAPYPGLRAAAGNSSQIDNMTKSFMAPVMKVPTPDGKTTIMVSPLIYVMSKQGTFYTLLQPFDGDYLGKQLRAIIN
jgi:protein SCO1/2